MRAGEVIDELRRCRGLLHDLRLDSDCDDRVQNVVRGLMQADADEVAELRRHADPDDVTILLEWSDRASSLAVRRSDPDLLVEAVFAFGFAESSDAPRWAHLQSQLRQAARIIGRDPGDAWDAAIALSDEQGAAWLDANRGQRRFMRFMRPPSQFSDPYDGGRFRFGRARAVGDRVPVATGLPAGDPRPDLSGATALDATPVVRDALEDLVADLWRKGRREDADVLLHAVLARDEPATALNELYAALADMPGAADSLLVTVLARA